MNRYPTRGRAKQRDFQPGGRYFREYQWTCAGCKTSHSSFTNAHKATNNKSYCSIALNDRYNQIQKQKQLFGDVVLVQCSKRGYISAYEADTPSFGDRTDAKEFNVDAAVDLCHEINDLQNPTFTIVAI